MTSRNRYGALSAAAALAAVVAIGVAFALARGADDSGEAVAHADPKAPAGAPSSPASNPEECRLKVTDAVLTLDKGFVSSLANRSVRIEAVPPARTVNARQIQLQTRASVDVSCDATTGVIGFRGGVRLRGEDGVLDLRRWRITAPDGALAAYLRPGDSTPINALRLDLQEAARSREGKVETIAAPLEMADGAVAVVNYAFGTGFRSRISSVGTVTLTAQRIEAA
jgi:hypothetical protein